MLYWRAQDNSNIFSHPTTSLQTCTDEYTFNIYFLLPSFLPLNYPKWQCHYCYCFSILLHSFPTSLPGQAGGRGTFKTRHTGESSHCWVLHVNCCSEEAECSTRHFTDPTKDETSLWILKCLKVIKGLFASVLMLSALVTKNFTQCRRTFRLTKFHNQSLLLFLSCLVDYI